MRRSEFYQALDKRIERTKETFGAKNEEYATDYNFMRNFDNGVGMSLHCTPEAVAWGYATKHLESIRSIILDVDNSNGSQLPTEERIIEKFGDAINYLIIIEAMLLEREARRA